MHTGQTGRDPSPVAPPAPPGWYPDPWRVAPSRWWDGFAWTAHVQSDAAAPQLHAALPQARSDVRGGGIALLGFVGALAISLLFARAAISAGASQRSLTTTIAGQFGLWTGLLMAAFIVTHRQPGGTLHDLGLRAPTFGEIKLGVGFGLAGLVVAVQVAAVLHALFPDDTTVVRSQLFRVERPSTTVVLVVGALACIGAPIFEELFFRGIVQGVLARHLDATPAIVVQAALFGSAHYQIGMTAHQAIVRIGTVSVLGVFLGVLRRRTGRLGAGMVAHATNNTVVVVLAILALGR